jgi:hypothetical protein
MAIPTVTVQAVDSLPSVEAVMERFGVDRYAAAVYLAVKSGDALVDDLVCVPSDQAEAILRAGEEAEAALFAAVERVDPAASVEANMDRLGLDRQMVEAALVLRQRVKATALAATATKDSSAEES